MCNDPLSPTLEEYLRKEYDKWCARNPSSKPAWTYAEWKKHVGKKYTVRRSQSIP